MATRGTGTPRSWWGLVVPLSEPQHEECLVGQCDRDSLGAELRDSASGRELVTYFDSRERAAAVAASLGESLRRAVRLEELIDGHWVEQYQASLQPFDLTSDLRVDPTGNEIADSKTICLVPGRAFGTGEHPTTRLSALALEKYVAPDTHWVDLGCGSAILSIVARLRGAERVLSIDLDPEAVEVARQVVRQNRIDRIELAVGSFEVAGGGWDGLVANILSGFFVEHGAELAPLLIPGGTLVASGYRNDEERLMTRTLQAARFEVVDRFESGGWGAMVCRRLDAD